VYGLAGEGASGVSNVVGILRRELEQSMALCGVNAVAGVTRDLIWHEP
jgi:isopentenyl diphosphate isomerase/L-lactate dehydrogenase-like FMN-dependent dehydrogenase